MVTQQLLVRASLSIGTWIQGKTDRRECFLNYFHRESAADTTSVQSKKSAVKPSIGGLFTFNSRFFIPEVDEKITERKEKMIKYMNKIYDINKRLPET